MNLGKLSHFLWGTLKRRLVLSVALVHGLLMTAFVMDSMVRQTQFFEKKIAQETMALAESLALPAAGWVSAQDLVGLQEIVQAQRRHGDVLWIFYYDSTGLVLAHTDARLVGTYVQDFSQAPGTQILADNGTYVDVAVPIKMGNQVVGWVRVGESKTATASKIQEILWAGVLYALGAIVIGILMALTLGHFFTRRLNRIQEVMVGLQAEAPGGQRVSLLGTDEAAQLAQEFNRMLEILEHRDAEILEREARWRAVLEQTQDGIILLDPQGTVISMNPAAVKLTGWSLEAALGQREDQVFCPQEWPEILGNPGPGLVLTAKTGAVHQLELSRCLIRDSGGKTLGTLIQFRDISERLKLQYSLQQTEKLESLGVLAGGIAHDFNNLLTGVLGYMELAQENLPQDSEARCYLQKALGVHARAKSLTLQLLTFSKGGSPRLQGGRLGPFLQDTVGFALAGAPIRVKYVLDPQAPPVEFDASQLGQVIENLVINARQAMPQGGTLEIRLGRAQELPPSLGDAYPGDFLQVSLQDSGPGVPAEIQGRVFDPFFTTRDLGTGLGLTTCFSIMTKHGGAIELFSPEGQGATFRLYLPISKKFPQEVPRMEGVSDSAPRGAVLVMDDEDFIREIFREILENSGYQVLEVSRGEEALEVLQQARTEGREILASVLDLTVRGGLGGVETVPLLNKIYPGMPLIATSGFAEDPVMAQPEVYGFQGALAKPFKSQDLLALLEGLLPVL